MSYDFTCSFCNERAAIIRKRTHRYKDERRLACGMCGTYIPGNELPVVPCDNWLVIDRKS